MDVIFLKSLRPLYCDYISRILCVRRAQQGRPPRPPFMYFYSRPCARGDRSFIPVPTFWLHFYSRPYARGDLSTRQRVLLCQNFYSRPYARGDLRRAVLRTLPLLISTRAPTRGATYREKPYPLTDEQFLLAPLHEGRQHFFTKPQVDLYDKLLKIHIFKLTLSVYSSIHLKTLTITLLGLHEPPGKMCTGRVGVRK